MGLLAFLPAFGYLLLILFGLHAIEIIPAVGENPAVGVFPYCINLPIFGGDIINYGLDNEEVRGRAIYIGGTAWYPTWGMLILIFALILLYWELLKSTYTSDLVSFDHALSTVVFIIYFGTWFTQPWAGNSLFLTLTLMALLDVIAGFTISISAARRDLSVGG